MELADPLWLLARQQQFGEFAGEDAGSPIDALTRYTHDMTSRVRLGSRTEDYNVKEGAPLETLIEREPVAARSAGGPSLRLRIEAGMHFLDRLRRTMTSAGAPPDDLPVPSDFPEHFWPTAPRMSNAAGRRFFSVFMPALDLDGAGAPRALDGHAVYSMLAEIPGILHADRPTEWSSVPPEDLPRPVEDPPGDASSPPSEAYKTAAEGFVQWYRRLYAEPDTAQDAWDPSRKEYNAAVSTGSEAEETVLEVSAYPGGRLDWYDFSPVRGGTLEPTVEAGDEITRNELPVRMKFRGMPAPRLWEMEDADVNLAALTAAGDDLSRLFLLEYALISGDDWFVLPIEAPVGSVTRINHLEVTDTFGRTTVIRPTVGRSDASGWSMFTFDLPAHPVPGLYLPPVLGASLSTSPVERVRFARDEMENLLFGIEETFEGPLGDPIDRALFTRPRLAVTALHPSPDADEEYLELTNQGDDRLDLSGLTVVAESGAGSGEIYAFGHRFLERRGTLRVYTGGDVALDTADRVHAELGEPRLSEDGVVAVYVTWEGAGDQRNRLLLQEPVRSGGSAEFQQYRIASDVPDHWFPFSLQKTTAGGQVFKLALLLDASVQSVSAETLPRPLGTVLDPSTAIPEEEITRGGLQVDRAYQLAAWLDGTAHLWAGREVRPGTGEESSGLRFDFLKAPEAT